MRGFDIHTRQSSCFSRSQIGATFAGLCFFCPIQASKKPVETQVPREKQYKHVPTHAASSFLRTTTPPTMGRAADSTLDDIAMGNLDPGVISNGDLAHDVTAEGQRRHSGNSLVEVTPATMTTSEAWHDELVHEEAVREEGLPVLPAPTGYSGLVRPRAESLTLGDSLPDDGV